MDILELVILVGLMVIAVASGMYVEQQKHKNRNKTYLPGLREKLAELEHDRWSRWMKYQFLHSRISFSAKGWTMAKDKVKQWQRQMQTAYHDLSEAEKEQDRIETDETIALLKQEGLL